MALFQKMCVQHHNLSEEFYVHCIGSIKIAKNYFTLLRDIVLVIGLTFYFSILNMHIQYENALKRNIII